MYKKLSVIAVLINLFFLRSVFSLDELCTRYLEKLGITGHIPEANLSLLELLQTNYIHTFSHDTIDSYFKRPISLDPKIIIAKFLSENRGGLCFELNGAFHYFLEQLGFDAILVSSHVYRVEKRTFNYLIDTHAVIVVKINEEQYLVDVGFADSFRKPIPLKNGILTDMSGSYKIEQIDTSYGLYKYLNEEWLLQYSFNLQSKTLSDFKENLAFVYNSPEHEFSNNLICTFSSATGHTVIIWSDQKRGKLLIKSHDDFQKIEIKTLAEVKKLLTSFIPDQLFRIKISA